MVQYNFNKLFTSCAGCNIPDCFHSHHSCSEAAKDGKPVYARAPCFSFVRNLLQLSQPKLSIFECGAEQHFDLHNNNWLDVLTARVYAARTRAVYHKHLSWGHLGLVRLINIFKKQDKGLRLLRRKNELLCLGVWRKNFSEILLGCTWKHNLTSFNLTNKKF